MNNYYFAFHDDLHNLLYSILKKICIKWIKKVFKFAMHFGWSETKKSKLLCDAFYILKLNHIIAFHLSDICLLDSPLFF